MRSLAAFLFLALLAVVGCGPAFSHQINGHNPGQVHTTFTVLVHNDSTAPVKVFFVTWSDTYPPQVVTIPAGQEARFQSAPDYWPQGFGLSGPALPSGRTWDRTDFAGWAEFAVDYPAGTARGLVRAR